MRILLVSNFFPPVNSIAAHRIYSFAKYLPQFGIDVEVVSPKREGTAGFDVREVAIHYPIKESRNANQFAKGKSRLRTILSYSGIRSWKYYISSAFYLATVKFIKPDFIKRFDAVLASFGNEDSLRIAYYLHRKYGLPMALDYRDLWRDNHYLNWTFVDKAIIYRLEKPFIQSAVLVTTVSEHLAMQLSSRYNVKPFVIYNGYWDALLSPSVDQQSPQSGSKTFCYCGSLYGGIRPLEVFMPLLASNSHYQLKIAVFSDIDREYIINLGKKYETLGQMAIHQNLDYQRAITLEKEADYLLLLNRLDGQDKGVLTGKLFEYMAIQKPIVGIGHRQDEAGELIRKHKLGVYGSSAQEIHQWLTGNKSLININTPREFSRLEQTSKLADLFKKNLGNRHA